MILSTYRNDCIEVMKLLKGNDVKVNHIITDPPYNISQDNNFSTMKSANRQGVDFGNWDKNYDVTEWLNYAYPLLDKDGSMVIFCSYRYITTIIDKIETLGGVVKDVMVWQKTNPMPRNRDRRYVQDMEFMIWAVKSNKSKWTFNRPTDKPYQRGFFQTPTLLGKERSKHPTQKPLALMREIIEIHTNENDLILDPFMGSGSTGVACIELGRNFIGVEREQEYYKIAIDRLNEIKNEPFGNSLY